MSLWRVKWVATTKCIGLVKSLSRAVPAAMPSVADLGLRVVIELTVYWPVSSRWLWGLAWFFRIGAMPQIKDFSLWLKSHWARCWDFRQHLEFALFVISSFILFRLLTFSGFVWLFDKAMFKENQRLNICDWRGWTIGPLLSTFQNPF